MLTRHSLYIIMDLKDNLQHNRVMFFFAIVIANNAFKCYETLEDLMKACLLRGRDSWTLEWKDEALNHPVL